MGRYILSRELINTKNYFNLNHHAGTLTNWSECKPEGSTISLSDNKNRPHVRELKTALDSGLYTMDSGFSVQILDNLVPRAFPLKNGQKPWGRGWILDSRSLSVELTFRIIPLISGISGSKSCIPEFKAQDLGFHEQKFPGLRIPQTNVFPDSLNYIARQECVVLFQ